MDGPKPETDKDRRICSICKQKPTISDSSTYCASCMGKRGNEKLRQRAIKAPKQEKDKRMKEETRPMPGKSIVGQIWRSLLTLPSTPTYSNSLKKYQMIKSCSTSQAD